MAGEQRSWSEREIRELVLMEVSTGQTMVVLNAASGGGALNTAVSTIARDACTSFEAQVAKVALMSEEMAAAKAQIDSILNDCRTFVQQTRDEAN